MTDIIKKQIKACGWGFDYTDKDVIEIQNKYPNATGEIDGQFYDLQNCVATMRAQAARIAELEAQCVTVKPLEWVDRDWATPRVVRDAVCESTSMVLFRIIECADGWELEDGMKCFNTVHKSSLCAENAAQDFHNARILSAITTQSADDVHNAAIDEVIEEIRPKNPEDDWTEYAHHKARICRIIRALKRNKGEG